MNELDNYKAGLEYFTDRCKRLEGDKLNTLLELYGNMSILINKSMEHYSIEIAYPLQSLQSDINDEIKNRINRGAN